MLCSNLNHFAFGKVYLCVSKNKDQILSLVRALLLLYLPELGTLP